MFTRNVHSGSPLRGRRADQTQCKHKISVLPEQRVEVSPRRDGPLVGQRNDLPAYQRVKRVLDA